MLRVYRRHDDRLLPTDLEVTAHSRPAEAAGALWLDLINPARQRSRTEALPPAHVPWHASSLGNATSPPMVMPWGTCTA